MIFTNIVCQACKSATQIRFEHAHETWGDMLAHMLESGFRIEGGPNQGNVRVVGCPSCATHPPFVELARFRQGLEELRQKIAADIPELPWSAKDVALFRSWIREQLDALLNNNPEGRT